MPRTSLRELVRPDRTAIVLQELQNGVVGAGSAFPDLAEAVAAVGVVESAQRLVRAARDVGVPVIHATAENLPASFGVNVNARLFVHARAAGADNAPGSVSVAPIAELGPAEGDLVLPRYHGLSPMTGGPLDSLLRNAHRDTLIVAGVSLNIAIPNLVFDAVNRSYRVVLVTDAVAGLPREYGDAVITHALSAIATLATTAELAHAWVGTNRLGPDA